MRTQALAAALLAALSLATSGRAGAAEVPVGFIRDPDVSARHVVVTHADELWIAPREGGRARKLTSLPGPHRFPRFDAAGEHVAFVRGEAGLLVWGDLYTVPVSGGEATRITHHPAAEILDDWTADGRLLYFGNASSPLFRRHQLFTIDARGGLATRMPVPHGAWASLDATGEWLAYVPRYSDFGESWKRYRGGNAADVWLVHLPTGRSRKITDWPGDDTMPMWHGRTVYYLSGAGSNGRVNLWAYDVDRDRRRQVTFLDEFDVRTPAIGPGPRGEGEIAFEHGGELGIVDLATGAVESPRITVEEADLPPTRRDVDAAALIGLAAPAPDGTAITAEARGDVWVLAPGQPPRNLTRTPGIAERDPAWSPDGRTIAFFSDASGEYELTLAPADGSGPPRRLTDLGAGFRSRSDWSPEGSRIAFVDELDRLWVTTVASGETELIDRDPYGFPPELAWSPDGRRIAYTRRGANFLSRILLHDLTTGAREELTTGEYEDTTPAFSPDGRTLYFASTRWFGSATFDNPRLGDVQRLFVNAQPQALIALDLGDRQARRVALPAAGGRWSFSSLAVNDRGQVVYAFFPLGQSPSIRLFDPATGSEAVLVEGADGFLLSADRRTIGYRSGGRLTLRAAAAEGVAAPVIAEPMRVDLDRRAEWRQLFADTWRLFRDYFYAANMHGVDWAAMRQRYTPLVDRVGSRRELNYVLDEMVNELGVSHAEVSGGDIPRDFSVALSKVGASFDVNSGDGVLGADLVIENGRYRFAAIHEGDATLGIRSPLAGSGVRAGHYLLAVEGTPLDVARDPLAAFVDRAGKPTRLTVATRADGGDARDVTIVPAASEADLRYLSWLRQVRADLDERSGGKIGFVAMPFTLIASQADFYRQFYGQIDKPALIVDARWNGGGEGAMQIVEALAREPSEYTVVRGSLPRPEPRLVHIGPKAMLINGMTGSGGDGLAHEFRLAGLGKLVGTRTWGGLVGNRGNPGLIDGGTLRIPSRGVFTAGGEWLIEGTGVEPDLEVEADPALFRDGRDPQLDAAVEELLRELATRPPAPARPEDPDRSGS